MSSSKEQIKEYITTAVNTHLKAHTPLTLSRDNWAKVIEGCRSAGVAEDIAAKYSVPVPDWKKFKSLDEAVDYVLSKQP